MTNTTNKATEDMTFTASTVTYVAAGGNAVLVRLIEAPRAVPRTETGPAQHGWKVRGVAEFTAGPAFEKYGAHRRPIDLGLTPAHVLAWNIAVAGAR